MTNTAIAELAPTIGVREACQAVGTAQASYYRRHRQSPPPQRPAPVSHRDRPQPRALSQAERQAILDTLHSDRFVDMSPTEVWATLLDEGVYLSSISTFYRLLRQGPSDHPLTAAMRPSTYHCTGWPRAASARSAGGCAAPPLEDAATGVAGNVDQGRERQPRRVESADTSGCYEQIRQSRPRQKDQSQNRQQDRAERCIPADRFEQPPQHTDQPWPEQQQ
jgi:putative transposase